MLIWTFLFKINRSQTTQIIVHLKNADSIQWCLPESRWPVLYSKGDDLSFLFTITEHHLTKQASKTLTHELWALQSCCATLMYLCNSHNGSNQKRSVITCITDDTLAYPACFCVLFFETSATGQAIQVTTQEVENHNKRVASRPAVLLRAALAEHSKIPGVTNWPHI